MLPERARARMRARVRSDPASATAPSMFRANRPHVFTASRGRWSITIARGAGQSRKGARMLGRRRDAHAAAEPLGEPTSWTPQEDAGGASERQVVELARRTGELQIADSAVLPPGSPWQRHNEQLGELRLAVVRRGNGRAVQRLDQMVAVAPVVVEDALDRAERDAAEADRLRAAADQHSAAADALVEARSALPRFRRGHRFTPLEMLIAATAFVGADMLILDLSLTLSPGGPLEHWLTA